MVAKKKNDDKKTVKPLLVVQIVHFCCTKCGDELEEVKMCKSCGATMRVIEVREKYGDDAQKFIDKLAHKNSQKVKASDNDSMDQLDELEVESDELERLVGTTGIFHEEERPQNSTEIKEKEESLSNILDKSEDDSTVLQDFSEIFGSGSDPDNPLKEGL